MAKSRAKHKRQTRSQTTRRYDSSSSEGEKGPSTLPQDIRHTQDVEMNTDSTQTPPEKAGTPIINQGEAMETNPPLALPKKPNNSTPRRKDMLASPDRRAKSACSSCPRILWEIR
ncbi:hypothetical protein DSO57_1029578 [Entomophthora muscae]|uniref:Uncharacterized protein n=1 Tax=Entomophthora muscae TaxID=34485 RepID=A0ACC2RFT7_9FUNG|nr:hypothetical protein DSO57_1029578 [Entomophthora muscae]